jgi:hypothetical protein
MNKEAIPSSETSVDFYVAVWQYNPEGRHVHSHRCENFKPKKDVEI